MTALGRFRALGAIGATYYRVLLMEGTDPVAWSHSDPALKLNMTLADKGSDEGWLFASSTDPTTVQQLLMQDPRVLEAVLVGGESEDVVAVGDASYVHESRPEPGKPEIALPGYIPKLPNSATKSLSWEEKLASQAPAAPDVAPPAPSPSKIPWWAWLAAAWALSRR